MYQEVGKMIEYTPIYNKFVTLYCHTKDTNVKKKSWDKICELVYKVTRFSYYSYVTKAKICRDDADDIISSCALRLLTRIKKWADDGIPYVASHLKTVIYNEINFALRNEKQQFYDNIESLDFLEEKAIAEEEVIENAYNDDED